MGDFKYRKESGYNISNIARGRKKSPELCHLMPVDLKYRKVP